MKKIAKLAVAGSLLAVMLTGCGSKATPEPTVAPSASPVATITPAKALEAKYKTQLETVAKNIEKYEDINVAIKDGYGPGSGFVPLMGYHFQNTAITEAKLEQPQILLYVLDGNKYKLVGAEWGSPDPKMKTPFDADVKMDLTHKASTHYDDGTEIEAVSDEAALPVSPETGAKKLFWHPDIYGMHAYVTVPNPDGAFETSNAALAPYSGAPSVAPIDEAHGISKENVEKLTGKK
jgi:hypothetical protein